MMSIVEAQRFRYPYQGDAATREKINAGLVEYQDMHLSHAGTQVRYGYFGKNGKNNIDFCLIEVTQINEDGTCVPSSSCGANNIYLEHADKIILEVNSWQDERLLGMHDIISVPAAHGTRVALPINAADDRKGSQVWKFDTSKVVAVVETNNADRNAPFKPPERHKKIAGHILAFFDAEVKASRLNTSTQSASATSPTPCWWA
jgi:succinyl-CoA:acetate CoA-transferase